MRRAIDHEAVVLHVVRPTEQRTFVKISRS